jgi:hypothetical protein
MLITDYLSENKTNKADVSKRIMPNRCDLCGIGIGKSMLYYENTWRPFSHIETKAYHYYWEKGRIKLCKECLDFVNKQKDPDVYLRKIGKDL